MGKSIETFLEKDAVTPEQIKELEELINNARKNGVNEIKFKLNAATAVGLQGKLPGECTVLLGAKKEGKIDVTIKF